MRPVSMPSINIEILYQTKVALTTVEQLGSGGGGGGRGGLHANIDLHTFQMSMRYPAVSWVAAAAAAGPPTSAPLHLPDQAIPV
jgi:hypothetical protein